MHDSSEVVRQYGQAWNETDEAARTELLDRSWGEDAEYIDPTAHVRSRAELVGHIGEFHRRWPGARIEMASGVDSHHRMLRFAWRLIGPDGAVLTEGIDFGEIGLDGRLRRIVGFFGPLPSA